MVGGLGLLFLALALGLDFKGLRSRRVQRDEQVRHWLNERHLKYYDNRFLGPKWFIVAGGVALMGLVALASGVVGLVKC